jgi:hypothetical protein
MPNLVRTVFDVRGSDKDIAEFKNRTIVKASELGSEGVFEEELGFDFRIIVPSPDGKIPEAEWAREHWGTSTNGFDGKILSDEPGHFVYKFLTKWTAPVPVIEKLGELFPRLTIDVFGYEVGFPVPNFAFEGRIENGKLDGLWEIDVDESFWSEPQPQKVSQ